MPHFSYGGSAPCSACSRSRHTTNSGLGLTRRFGLWRTRMPARNAVAADYVVVALRGRLAKVRRGHRRPTAAGLRLLDPLLGLEVLLGDPVARHPERGTVAIQN